MMKCSDEDKQPKDEFRYSLTEGAKNLNDVFLPESISVPDPVSVHGFAIALRMKPHLLIAGCCASIVLRLKTQIDFNTVSILCSRYGVIAIESSNQVMQRTPKPWRAVVKDGQIAEWQVYADNKPVYELLFE